jgi:hypothetical protein
MLGTFLAEIFTVFFHETGRDVKLCFTAVLEFHHEECTILY